VAVPGPPIIDDPASARAVRDVFDAAGYTDQGVVETLGSSTLVGLGPKRLPALLRRTGAGTPRETLIRLFILGVPVDQAAVRAAVGPTDPGLWLDLGLIEPADAGRWRATVQVRAYQGLLVTFDLSPQGSVPGDHVMGISPSSLGLAGMTVRKPIGRALDLGCGSGFQALLAAGHAGRVAAVDLNPRAIAMTRFNRELNGLANLDVLLGDLFEPVAAERFDLIVSNPPFVISPEHSHFFLHSGLQGDDICRNIVRDAPALLAEGGFCQLLANWENHAGQPWEERLAGWFEGSGCDAWVMHQGTHALDEYASGWMEPQEAGPGHWDRSFGEWMRYYDERGIESIGSGLISMRRRDGANWFRADEAPAEMSFPCGDDIVRAFEAGDALGTTSDRTLLDCRLVLADGVHLSLDCVPSDSGWRPSAAQVLRTTGLKYRGSIDVHGSQVLAGFDGKRTFGELLAGIAADLGADVGALAERAVPIVRRLIEQGFVLRVPGDGS
jgi:SAM-dependent methyltransferase